MDKVKYNGMPLNELRGLIAKHGLLLKDLHEASGLSKNTTSTVLNLDKNQSFLRLIDFLQSLENQEEEIV